MTGGLAAETFGEMIRFLHRTANPVCLGFSVIVQSIGYVPGLIPMDNEASEAWTAQPYLAVHRETSCRAGYPAKLKSHGRK